MNEIKWKGWRIREYIRPIISPLTAADVKNEIFPIADTVKEERVLEAVWNDGLYIMPSVTQMMDVVVEVQRIYGRPPTQLVVLPERGAEIMGVPVV